MQRVTKKCEIREGAKCWHPKRDLNGGRTALFFLGEGEKRVTRHVVLGTPKRTRRIALSRARSPEKTRAESEPRFPTELGPHLASRPVTPGARPFQDSSRPRGCIEFRYTACLGTTMSVPMFASSLQADENADAFMLGMNFFYDPDSFESPAVLALRQDTAKSLRRLGARISTEYDKDATTHVVLMTTQGGAEAMLCKRAIKDRKRVVSWSWIEACIHKGELVPIDDCVPLPSPPTLDGHPDMANVRVCVTGYTGERRQQLIDMCKSLGCEYMRVLDRKSTHLVCYEFEGAKWAKANQTGLQRIVSHRWLEECLRQWKRLDETPYTTHSGREGGRDGGDRGGPGLAGCW